MRKGVYKDDEERFVSEIAKTQSVREVCFLLHLRPLFTNFFSLIRVARRAVGGVPNWKWRTRHRSSTRQPQPNCQDWVQNQDDCLYCTREGLPRPVGHPSGCQRLHDSCPKLESCPYTNRANQEPIFQSTSRHTTQCSPPYPLPWHAQANG